MPRPSAKIMTTDIDDFKSQIDAVDTRFGHDPIVGELIATLDKMIESLESHGKVYRRRKHQGAGVSGFRNVTWHQHSEKWVGRIGYTDGKGKRRRKSTRYYTTPEEASIAVEELRAKLGLT